MTVYNEDWKRTHARILFTKKTKETKENHENQNTETTDKDQPHGRMYQRMYWVRMGMGTPGKYIHIVFRFCFEKMTKT